MRCFPGARVVGVAPVTPGLWQSPLPGHEDEVAADVAEAARFRPRSSRVPREYQSAPSDPRPLRPDSSWAETTAHLRSRGWSEVSPGVWRPSASDPRKVDPVPGWSDNGRVAEAWHEAVDGSVSVVDAEWVDDDAGSSSASSDPASYATVDAFASSGSSSGPSSGPSSSSGYVWSAEDQAWVDALFEGIRAHPEDGAWVNDDGPHPEASSDPASDAPPVGSADSWFARQASARAAVFAAHDEAVGYRPPPQAPASPSPHSSPATGLYVPRDGSQSEWLRGYRACQSEADRQRWLALMREVNSVAARRYWAGRPAPPPRRRKSRSSSSGSAGWQRSPLDEAWCEAKGLDPDEYSPYSDAVEVDPGASHD